MPVAMAKTDAMAAMMTITRRDPDAESATSRVTDSMARVNRGPYRPVGEIPMKKNVTIKRPRTTP